MDQDRQGQPESWESKLRLELWGLGVDEASDGAEGARRILADRPEVAIVDIGLPEADGYEVARRVRANHVLHDDQIAGLRYRIVRFGGDQQPEKPVRSA